MPDMNDVQGELMDMIIADKSPSQISDRIKDMLFAKSAERVDAYRPEVAKNSFNADEDDPESQKQKWMEILVHQKLEKYIQRQEFQK